MGVSVVLVRGDSGSSCLRSLAAADALAFDAVSGV